MSFKESVTYSKSYDFAVRIVRMCKYIQKEKKEYVLSKQILRSGTAIGALLREAAYAQSRADFCNKLQIGLKEANESLYWLDLLFDSEVLGENEYLSVKSDCEELVRLLVSSVKSSKQ